MKIVFKEDEHKYFIDGIEYPSVTRIISQAGLCGNTEWFTEQSRVRGRHVHIACHYYDEQDLDMDSFSKDYWGYLDAYKLFSEEVKPIWEFIEHKVACPIRKYAGTFDRSGLIFNKSGILDIKTGPPSPATGIQLAGYTNAFKKTNYKRWGLYLTKDGKYKLIPYENKNDLNIFISSVNLFYWKQNNNIKEL